MRVKLQHRLRYNLIGHNCEIIANMCASRNWTESYQVRRWFGREAAAGVVLLFGIAALSWAGRSLGSPTSACSTKTPAVRSSSFAVSGSKACGENY